MELNYLKSTGVVRRIDDLGRIVIPKEIRRNLKIRDGENMEIFVDLDSIILKKYSKLEDVLTLTDKIAKKMYEISGFEIIITDRDHILTSYGESFDGLKNELISDLLIEFIDNRTTYKEHDKAVINITKNKSIEGYYYINPLISEADSIGLVVIKSNQQLNESALILAKMIEFLLCSQVDIS